MDGPGAGLAAAVDEAVAGVTEHELLELAARMVDIPSPTGEERALAEFVAAHLSRNGVPAACQMVSDTQANAVARLKGSGEGPDLVFYAPLDTAFSPTPGEDEPWLDLGQRGDLQARAVIEDGFLRGAGAHNPKGHAAAVIAAGIALARCGAPLKGDVILALCGGAMPTLARPMGPAGAALAGHGSGISFALQSGLWGDFAVCVKAGTVAWEEVGLTWFRIRVHGLPGYVGTRKLMRYRNPILAATKIVERLEAWFPSYTARNRGGTIAPQGAIGCIQAGWPHKPVFNPATCEIHLDLRAHPDAGLAAVKRQFDAEMRQIAADLADFRVEWEMVLAVPGTRTAPDNWIVRSSLKAWEAVMGAAPPVPAEQSGATEANILRRWGLPTSRVGLPAAPVPGRYDGLFGMGEVHGSSLTRLTRLLVHIALDTSGRPLGEVGLRN